MMERMARLDPEVESVKQGWSRSRLDPDLFRLLKSGPKFVVCVFVCKAFRCKANPEIQTDGRMQEQSLQMTTGSHPIHKRLSVEMKSVLFSVMQTSRQTFFCICKPFLSQGHHGILLNTPCM